MNCSDRREIFCACLKSGAGISTISIFAGYCKGRLGDRLSFEPQIELCLCDFVFSSAVFAPW